VRVLLLVCGLTAAVGSILAVAGVVVDFVGPNPYLSDLSRVLGSLVAIAIPAAIAIFCFRSALNLGRERAPR
jgi:hypothetical protein